MSSNRRRRGRRRRRLTLESVTRIGLLITLILVLILCIVLISRCDKEDEPNKVTASIPQTTNPVTDDTNATDDTDTTDATDASNQTSTDENSTTDNNSDETTSDNSSAVNGDTICDDGKVIICVDAGHGGIDGGSGDESRLEKYDTLNLSLMIQEELEALGATVVMTRTDDTEISKFERPVVANNANADVLLSIHRNSYAADSSVKGVEAWICSTNSDNSSALANAIIAGLEEVGITRNRGVRSGSQGNANEDYAINSQSNMPSLILELGFITSPEDNNYYDTKMREYAKSIAKTTYDWVLAQ